MNIDLSEQFVTDFEELRKKAENSEAVERLEADVKRLEAKLKRVRDDAAAHEEEELKRVRDDAAAHEEEELKRVRDDAAAHEEGELKRVRDDAARERESLAARHAQVVSRHEDALKAVGAEADRQVKEKKKKLEDTLQKWVADERRKRDQIVKAELDSARERVITELEGRFDELANVPLGMRVSALVVDAVAVVLAGSALRSEAGWGTGHYEGLFVVGLFVVFSLRCLVSPGSLLLGISARQIGPDHRPDGPARLKARLNCGLLHYGPLVATAVAAAWDESTRRGLTDLLDVLGHPLTSEQPIAVVLARALWPSPMSLPGAVLAVSLVWWGLLLTAIVFSPLIHRGSPYFRNTTLVEWMWRVGFLRFSPPAIAVDGPILGPELSTTR